MKPTNDHIDDVNAEFLDVPNAHSYATLCSIPFKLIPSSHHKYYNSIDPAIRRNESYKTAVVLKQSNILEL